MHDTNRQTIETYDRSVELYIEATPKEVSGTIQTWIDTCLARLEPSATILEIGTAQGKDADYIESRGFTVERTDASIAFVDYQRDKGYTARVLNVLTDDIRGRYDMVFADAVWLHFTREEVIAATKKVFDALHGGGIFAFSVKEGEGEELTDQKLNSTRYFCYWREPDMRRLLEDSGFTDIDIQQAVDYRPGRSGWLLIIATK